MTQKNQKVDWKIGCTGLVVTCALALGALALGYNGMVLKTAFVIIGFIIGLPFANPFKK